MNCTEVRQHLPVYADGELRGELGREVQTHVAACPYCRTETARWQALRRCARRTLAATAVPMSLRPQIVASLRGGGGSGGGSGYAHRLLRWGGAAAALAAVILLAVLWPSKIQPGQSNQGGASGNGTRVAGIQVQADNMAFIHNYCAINHTHDAFECGGKDPHAACDTLCQKMHFKVLMPDLTEKGYRLAGACWCIPSDEVRGVHAFYRKADPALKGEAISFFSMNHPVAMQECSTVNYGTRESRRTYETACIKGLNIVKWNNDNSSYAICGKLSREELFKLADSVDVAQRMWNLVCLASTLHP